jgi:mono/diheme cytochrome c family protein
MRPFSWALAVSLCLIAAAIWEWTGEARRADPGIAPPSFEELHFPGADQAGLLQRGSYLARAADCAACHTATGGESYAGGRPFKLPFGTMYATNITADRETGIGSWSDDEFVDALREGVGKNGHLYPSMPYTSYTGMSRDDALAIKAYLFSLPAVHQVNRRNDLPFPFSQRWTLWFWNRLFLEKRRFHLDAGLTPVENRGAYLATALGHCGECHTPRNVGFAMKSSRRFAGAQLQGWQAWNITSDPRFGIGGWSDEQLFEYLTTGCAHGRGSASGPMAEVVENSLQYLTRHDAEALVAYLRKVPAPPRESGTEVNLRPAPAVASSAWAPAAAETHGGPGRALFEDACASCHQWNGQGQQTPYAALLGDQTVNDPNGTNVVQVMLLGAHLTVGDQTVFMPSFGEAYTDEELAAIANYVVGHFADRPGQVTADQLRKARSGG